MKRKSQRKSTQRKQTEQKNKRAALQALKRKKRYEKQLQQIDGTLSTLEFQREALENASTNTEVLRVMNDVAKAFKSAHTMDIDDVHNIMDDISEQMQVQNEIQDAIASVGVDHELMDEDELMAELEALEQEGLDEKLLEVTTTDQLPSAPAAEPVAPSKAKSKAEDESGAHKEFKMLAS